MTYDLDECKQAAVKRYVEYLEQTYEEAFSLCEKSNFTLKPTRYLELPVFAFIAPDGSNLYLLATGKAAEQFSINMADENIRTQKDCKTFYSSSSPTINGMDSVFLSYPLEEYFDFVDNQEKLKSKIKLLEEEIYPLKKQLKDLQVKLEDLESQVRPIFNEYYRLPGMSYESF